MQLKIHIQLIIAAALTALLELRRLLRPVLTCAARYVHECAAASRLQDPGRCGESAALPQLDGCCWGL
jgi:hypothetical protein